MQLIPNSLSALVNTPINCRGNGQRTSDHCCNAGQEGHEALRSDLAVDDFHRRNVIAEENAGNTAVGVKALLVSSRSVRATSESPLVGSHAVLVGFDRRGRGRGGGWVVVERVVRSRHDFNEVHVVVRGLDGCLDHAVERVRVMVVAPLVRKGVGEFRSKAQAVDLVREDVSALDRSLVVVRQIVEMQVAVAETAAGSNVEVANDFVDVQIAFDSASFLSLLVEALGVAFTFALLHVLAAAESPGVSSIGLTNFLAGIAAVLLDSILRRRGTITATAIIRVEMRSSFFSSMPVSNQRLTRNLIQFERTHKSKAFISITSPDGLNLTLLTPCDTPVCCSPETSITSNVNNSHGIRGKLIFK